MQQGEERRTLHLGEMGALKKRIEELQLSMKDKDTIYINKRVFWNHSWSCVGCIIKTYQNGKWTGPHCKVKHLNRY